MGYTVISDYVLEGEFFLHVLYLNEDDRCEIIDENKTPLLIFTADCGVKTPSGEHLGRFCYTDKTISFKPSDEEGIFKGLDLKVENRTEAIFKLERDVFKAWYQK